ncbi:hypothetical protein H1C71_035017 [Ictidomys tridecemlineatus]|nr:hypothetical protein H1C71_035017 [Ictidomys tridecemlineatus]
MMEGQGGTTWVRRRSGWFCCGCFLGPHLNFFGLQFPHLENSVSRAHGDSSVARLCTRWGTGKRLEMAHSWEHSHLWLHPVTPQGPHRFPRVNPAPGQAFRAAPLARSALG